MSKIINIIIAIILSLLVIAGIILSIYCFINYGNKPIDEVPVWALWFMFGGKN